MCVPITQALHSLAGLLNRCDWGAAASGFRPGDAAVLKTAPAFVDAVAELIMPLLAGVPLVRLCLALPARVV